MKANENPLAQNELGRKITTWSERIEPHTNKILGVGLLAAVIVVGVMIFTRSGSEKTTKAWSDYYAAKTPADLESFAEDHAGAPPAGWALVEAAQLRMSEGAQTSLTNRADSVKSLDKAKKDFEAALKLDLPVEIRERALIGLATVNEYLCEGDTAAIVSTYEDLLRQYPDTTYRKWAEHRIEVLKKPETAEFYKWFAKQDPKPTDRPLPADGKPKFPSTGIPEVDLFNSDFMKDLKTAPADTKKPATDDKKPEEKGAEEKKPEGTPDKPTTEKPAEGDKPADPAKPADGEKPAEDKKSEGEPAAPATPPEKPAEEAKPAADAEKPAPPAEEKK
jgi:hypothetical protein